MHADSTDGDFMLENVSRFLKILWHIEFRRMIIGRIPTACIEHAHNLPSNRYPQTFP